MLLKYYISLPAIEVNSKYFRYHFIISNVYHIRFPAPKQTLCQLLDNLASCDRNYHLWLTVGKRSQFYDWFPTSIVTICEIKYISHSFLHIYFYDVMMLSSLNQAMYSLHARITFFFFSKLSTKNKYQRKRTRFVLSRLYLYSAYGEMRYFAWN